VMNHLWTVVLAAGAGRRLTGVTHGTPKQFWCGPTGQSLLDHTLDRFAPLSPPARTVVVIDATHRSYIAGTSTEARARIVEQPCDRGTAAGVLSGLLPVLDTAPDAVVTITPSDHGVADDRAFRRGLLAAIRHVELTDAVVLIGAPPSGPRTDYGWIMPEVTVPSMALTSVTAFVEKPAADTAARLFASGAVWNTMVVVARTTSVWDLYADVLPGVWDVFATARRLPAGERATFIASAYTLLSAADFSSEVLTPARQLSTLTLSPLVGWSDLGTPDRLHEWHLRSRQPQGQAEQRQGVPGEARASRHRSAGVPSRSDAPGVTAR
jgi:mannose-1-phosphate guanylyltransferase